MTKHQIYFIFLQRIATVLKVIKLSGKLKKEFTKTDLLLMNFNKKTCANRLMLVAAPFSNNIKRKQKTNNTYF